AHCEFQTSEFLNAVEVNAGYSFIRTPRFHNFRPAPIDGSPERLVCIGVDIQVGGKPAEVKFKFSHAGRSDTPYIGVKAGLGYCLPGSWNLNSKTSKIQCS